MVQKKFTILVGKNSQRLLMKLNRNLVNKIRYFLENCIPPVLRDSIFFYGLLKFVFKDKAAYYAAFRPNLIRLTKEDYKKYYENFPNVMGETDLNVPCLKQILANLSGNKILDAGCGRGFLVQQIKNSGDYDVTGIDIHIDETMRAKLSSIHFQPCFIDKLPFQDKSFDTVVCTHTLEHVTNIQDSLRELRRVAKSRLIIVVPMEREYKYSFNLHVHFFPYLHSFINTVASSNSFTCIELDGDIYYQEEIA